MSALLADFISWICILAGSVFVITGAVGLVRLPEFYTRLHAIGITDTLGAGLVLLGLAFQAGFDQVSIKLLLIIVFMLFTGPAATHALAKAALHGKLTPLLSPSDNEETKPSNLS